MYSSSGDTRSAAESIDNALTQPPGRQQVRDLFTRDPKIQEMFRASFDMAIAEMSLVYQPVAIHEKLMRAKLAGVLPDEQINGLLMKLNKETLSRNLSGAIPFDLGDNVKPFPDFQAPAHQAAMLERTIKALQVSGGSRQIRPLIKYVQQVGPTSTEGKRIEMLLPSINIRRDELDEVAKLYPAFAAARKEATMVRVQLKVKNGDRLFADDIQQMLRANLKGVDWVTELGPKVLVLGIERVRHDERTLPERTQTITYAQHQVSLLSAALLMPRNASYLYEVISGGAEIEYGYVVDAVADGKTVYDKVIRGRVGGEYQRCQNARIQNVFGGVNPADFVANDDQQQRCSGASAASMDRLRREVLSKVVDGVRELPVVRAAEALNQ